MCKSNIQDVKNFWESHPLCSYEIKFPVGSREFFEEHNRIKNEDAETFCKHLWRLDKLKGMKVLDVGCGPGWLVRAYAAGGSKVVCLDLAYRSVELTRVSLDIFGLHAEVLQGNAEQLPFRDETFDFVACSGVLHHTPDTQRGIDEIYRVLRPDGEAVISLYYKNLLLSNILFPITKQLVKYLLNVPGRKEFKAVRTVNDFTRIYDGDENPIGKAYSRQECLRMFQSFKVKDMEVHYFPKRFLPCGKKIPRTVHRILDKYLGTMIHVELAKE